MKSVTKTTTGATAVAEELGRLEARKAEAERQRAENLTALEDARQARRAGLSSDSFDVDASSKRIRDLDAAAADLQTLIADLDAAIEATAGRFRDAKEAEERAAAAEKLEGFATAAEAAGSDLEKAVVGLAKAVRALLATVPPDVGMFPARSLNRPTGRPEGNSLLASPREAIAAVVAEAVAYNLPEIVDGYRDNGYYRRSLMCVMNPEAANPTLNASQPTNPLATSAAVAALITNRLRDRAEAIRTGAAGTNLSDVSRPDKQRDKPRNVELIALENVAYLAHNGNFLPKRQLLAAGKAKSFAPDDAEKLIATGAFAATDSDEGRAFAKKLEDRRIALAGQRGLSHAPSEFRFEDCRDIGDPMGLRAERGLDAKPEDGSDIELVALEDVWILDRPTNGGGLAPRKVFASGKSHLRRAADAATLVATGYFAMAGTDEAAAAIEREKEAPRQFLPNAAGCRALGDVFGVYAEKQEAARAVG